MTFDLCNSLKPHSPGGRPWQSAQETLGFQKMIVQKIPPGGGGGGIGGSRSIWFKFHLKKVKENLLSRLFFLIWNLSYFILWNRFFENIVQNRKQHFFPSFSQCYQRLRQIRSFESDIILLENWYKSLKTFRNQRSKVLICGISRWPFNPLPDYKF